MPKSSLTGEFRDGPFVGLQYKTSTQSGTISEDGKFSYQDGEVVTFSVGTLDIGSAVGAPSLTLANLDGISGTDLFRPSTVNRARFLLSFSRERDFRSGVAISDVIVDTINDHSDDIHFDFDIESFEKDDVIQTIFTKLNLPFRGVAEIRNHLRRSIQGIKALRDVKIPIRDGSWLGADVFHPIGKGPWPVLMSLSVYGRAFQIGAILNDDDFRVSEEREDAWQEKKRENIPVFFKWSEVAFRPNVTDWVPRGYVMIRVDHRGIGPTPGVVNPFSPQEALDYYDAIEWAAKQAWSDGNIGLFGASYHATNQWNVAALHPPSLKAIAPLACDSDAYRDLSYPGGLYIGKYRKYWWNVLVGKARNPESGAVDFIEGFERHPFDDGYYHGERLATADFSKIHIPVLTSVSQTELIHSRGGFEAFREVRSASKHLLVWDAFYMPSMIEDSDADLRTFFDKHLKGITPAQDVPPVRMMVRTGDSKFEWRDAVDWPLPNTNYREFFLEAGAFNRTGGIGTVQPKSEGFVEYSADVERSTTLPMAAFETAPLDKDLDFAGHIKAKIWVSSTSSDADIWIALRIMDGEREVQYRTLAPSSFQNDPQAQGARKIPAMTMGSLKASRRAKDPILSTPYRPWHTHREQDVQPLTPNEPVELEVEIFASAGRIKAGWRMRVEITPIEGPGNLPGFERAYDESYHRDATNRIYTGGSHASSITIPVVA